MRLLALDQATNFIGWSIWDDKKLIDYGLKDFSNYIDTVERIHKIKTWLQRFISNKNIQIVAIEDTFLQMGFKGKPVGVDSFKLLNKLMGVVEDSLYTKQLLYFVIKPTEWKSTLGIKGRKREEQKKSSIDRVKKLFNIEVSDDVADAIGIGYHVVSKYLNKIEVEKES